MTGDPSADKGFPAPTNPPPPLPPTRPEMLPEWAVGTMIVHGFPRVRIEDDLRIARAIGASCVELLPHWKTLPDAREAADRVRDAGLKIHSVHGSWGSQFAVRAPRVDLASTDEAERRRSLDDLRTCIEWSVEVGARVLVIHPGGLSDPMDALVRGRRLADSLATLAEELPDGGPVLGIENMPPGVHPGSDMADLAQIVGELDRPDVRLVLDTGHAALTQGVEYGLRTSASLLISTHIHDNDGRQDTHLVPGDGAIAWQAWRSSLASSPYRGVLLLECIRALRDRRPRELGELGRRLAMRLLPQASA